MNRHGDPPSNSETEQSFLQRWSRRKRETREASESAPPVNVQAPEAQPAPEPPGDEDMPPLDSLSEGSDVSAFFSPRVSEELRQAALRQLFRKPEFNYSDGLDVYCGDYRHFKPLGDIMTAAMRHRLDVARQRLAHLIEEGPDANDAKSLAPSALDEHRDDPVTQRSTNTAHDSTDPTGGDNGHS